MTFVLLSTDLEGGRYFFNAFKESESILFACDDENEYHLWVMAMYRATGQSHKPTPLNSNAVKNSTISKLQGGELILDTNICEAKSKLIYLLLRESVSIANLSAILQKKIRKDIIIT